MRRSQLAAAFAAAALAWGTAMAQDSMQDRMPEIPADRLTEAQRQAAEEFVILITAREWTQQLEWAIHHPIALEAGLDPAIARAVAEGRRPENMPEEEALAWAFSTELHHNKSVSDATYAKVVEKFGEHGAIDMAGVNGYYTFLAMAMNMARTPPPNGAEPALKPYPK